MATTAADMTRFLAFLLDPERTPGVLEPGTLAEMVRVHHRVDSARGGSGLAWAVERGPGTHVVYHGGGLPSQTSHLRLDLDAGTGAIVLANAEDADPAAYAEEGLALLRLAAAASGGGAGASGGDAGGARRSVGGAGRTAPAARPAPAFDPVRYTGRYRWGEREAWVVSLGGSLWIIDPAWTTDPLAGRPTRSATRLVPLGGHRFRLEGGGARGETAEFVVDAPREEVIRLRMPSLVYRRTGSIAE
jgi:hypothetical protein